MLPNLIIIGAPKSGTSALHYYLNLHPEISMSRVKELNYFVDERNWGRGLDWYKAQFDQPAKIRGESSPVYSRYPAFSNVPERMHALIPDARLIYIIRDPIDRILSHYVMALSTGMTTLNFADAMADFEGSAFVDQSLYFMQLERYLAYYPDSQILILTHEQLLHQRGETLARVFEFLEVDATFQSKWFSRKINRGSRYRKRNHVGEFLSRLPIAKWVEDFPSGLRYWFLTAYYYPFSKPIERPVLDDELRGRLTECLRSDVIRLQEYCGREFDEWDFVRRMK